MSRMVWATGLLLVSFSVSATPDFKPGACKEDIQKFCGGKATPECMNTNFANLSPECQKRVKFREERHAAIKAACSADMEKLCKGKSDREAFLCLRQKKKELSEGCLKTLKRPREGKDAKAPS